MSKLSMLPLIERLEIWGGPEIMSECIVELQRNAEQIERLTAEVTKLRGACKNYDKACDINEARIKAQNAVISEARAFCKLIDDNPSCMNDFYPNEIEEALKELDSVSGSPEPGNCKHTANHCAHGVWLGTFCAICPDGTAIADGRESS